MPKKQTSTPSICSKTNIALVRNGNCSGNSPMYRSFIRVRVSKTLSEEETTRIVTYPASAVFVDRIKLLTRSSRKVESLVVGSPVMRREISGINQEVRFLRLALYLFSFLLKLRALRQFAHWNPLFHILSRCRTQMVCICRPQ